MQFAASEASLLREEAISFNKETNEYHEEGPHHIIHATAEQVDQRNYHSTKNLNTIFKLVNMDPNA